MANKSPTVSGPQSWRSAAEKYPELEAVPSCNKTAFKARKKSFLFLGEDENSYNIMVKLGDSRAEAEELAAKNPDRISVGPHWTTAEFDNNAKLARELVERWVEESFRLVAPKTLVKAWEETSNQ